MVKNLFKEVEDEVLEKSVPTIQKLCVEDKPESEKVDEQDVNDSSPRLR